MSIEQRVGMWSGVKFALAVFVFLGTTAAVRAYDADTMAIYPFTEASAGTDVPNTSGYVKNAIDNAQFAATRHGGKVTEAPITYQPLRYSDDIPGAWVYEGGSSTPIFSPSNPYQSMVFPDMLASEDGPAGTNTASRTCYPVWKAGDNSVRQMGYNCLQFAGLDTAIGAETDWTVEMFVKHDSPYTGQVLLSHNNSLADSGMKFVLKPCNGRWNNLSVDYARTSDGNNANVYKEYDTSFNFSTCGWYHLAAVHTGADTTTRVYKDGLLALTITNHKTEAKEVAKDLLLGEVRNFYPSGPFYGRVALFRVMKRALATTEFLQVFSAEKPDDLVINGDYVVPAEGQTAQNVVITAQSKITGGKLTVAGNVTYPAAEVEFANDGLELSGATSVNALVSGSVLKMNAVLSGSAAISLTGPGTVYFNAANTFTGTLDIQDGVVFHAANDLAFGSPAAGTIYHGVSGSKICFDGIETYEPIDHYGDDSNRYLEFSAHTTNVLHGTFNGKGGRMQFNLATDSYTVLSNALNGMSYPSHFSAQGAVVHVWGPYKTQRLGFNGSGATVYLHARPAENLAVAYGINDSATYVTCIPNAFCEAADSATAWSGATLKARFLDLNGYDQRVACLGNEGTMVTSDTPAVLHVDNVSSGGWNASPLYQFTGKVTLSFEGAGTGTVTLGKENTSTGRLLVSGGADVALSSAGKWNGDLAVSGAGSKFTFRGTAGFPSDAHFTVSDGGAIDFDIGGGYVAAKKVTVGDADYTAAGTYGPVGSGATHEFASFTGNGGFVIYSDVEGKTTTWAPDAQAVNPSIASAANWKDSSVPDLSEGVDTAVFSETGDTVGIGTTAYFNGVTMTRPVNGGFTFNDLGGGLLKIGIDGLNVTTDSSRDESRFFTNNVPTFLEAAQTWNLLGTGTVWRQTAPISGAKYSPLTFSGDGFAYLAGDNSGLLGDVFIRYGNVDPVSRGVTVQVENDRALGTGNKVTVNTENGKNARLVFAGGTNMVFNQDFDFLVANDNNNYPPVKFNNDCDVEFKGKVTFTSYNRSPVGANSRIVFSGGYENKSGNRGMAGNNSTIVFSNAVNWLKHFSVTANCTYEIWSSDNHFDDGSYGLDVGGGIVFDLHAENAISTNYVGSSALGYRSPRFWFDRSSHLRPKIKMNGFDQSISYIQQRDSSTDDAAASIESDAPATMSVYQGIDGSASMLAFNGQASLKLSGPGTLTLTHTPSPTTGDLIVDGGHLALGASWPNTSKVEVKAGGALACQENELFSRRATALYLETGATLALGATTQTVFELYVDGVKKPSATYTAGSAALSGVTLTGSGSLVVYGTPGTMLIFR